MTSAALATGVAVVLEVGARRSFASALDWPGWSRSGRDPDAALAALAASASRYGAALAASGVTFAYADAPLVVVEELAGSATTDFGAPGAIAAAEAAPLTAEEAGRRVACVGACWAALDAAAATAPAALRRGPRGGGRDRDAVVRHVREAERAYAAKIGLRLPTPVTGEPVAATRALIAAALRPGAAAAPRWPLRYAARRIAWHALDHAWEIEDRSV